MKYDIIAVMKAPLTEVKQLSEVYNWLNQTVKSVFKDPVCGDGKNVSCAHVFIFIHMKMYMYVCMHVCKGTHIFQDLFTDRIYSSIMCVYVYVRVCMFAHWVHHVYTYAHIHLYIHE